MITRRTRKRKGASTQKAAPAARVRRGPVVVARKRVKREYIAPMLVRSPVQQSMRESGGYLHVSDLIHKCTRALALSQHASIPVMSEPIFESRGLTFAQGHAIQDYVTGRLIANYNTHLYGVWSCVCGHTKQEGVHADIEEGVCQVCQQPVSKYNEVVIRNEEMMLTGALDILVLDNSRFHIGECKSMASSRFNDLRRPVPDHLIQALLYWWLAREAGMPLWDSLTLLYVNKDFVWGSPFKDYTIVPSSVIDRIDPYLEEACELAKFRSTKKRTDIPLRTSCATIDSPLAKKCQFANVCFNIQ